MCYPEPRLHASRFILISLDLETQQEHYRSTVDPWKVSWWRIKTDDFQERRTSYSFTAASLVCSSTVYPYRFIPEMDSLVQTRPSIPDTTMIQFVAPCLPSFTPCRPRFNIRLVDAAADATNRTHSTQRAMAHHLLQHSSAAWQAQPASYHHPSSLRIDGLAPSLPLYAPHAGPRLPPCPRAPEPATQPAAVPDPALFAERGELSCELGRYKANLPSMAHSLQSQ